MIVYTGTYKIADRVIEISSLYEEVQLLCKDYRFVGEAEIPVRITAADIEFERRKSAREDELEGIPVRSFSESYLETLAVYRKIAEKMLDYDTILFHGSAVALDGEAVLFTAKSGTGKSTHTRLWREAFGERVVMVNDDKPLLRIGDGHVWVYGTPWDGKHHLSTNCMVPLRAICILERGEHNRVDPVEPGEILPMLLQQSHRPENSAAMMQYLQLLDRMTETLSFYRLKCNMDPEAAQVCRRGIFDSH